MVGTRHLNKEIINNVKIAQGAKIMKNRIELENANVVKTFETLGSSKMFELNSTQHDQVISHGIDPKDSLFYDSARIKNIVFTSSLHKKTKTNSFTVKVKFNDENKYAIINCFIQIDNSYYLLVQYLDVVSTNNFAHTKTKSVVKHIMPFKVSNVFNVINVEQIKSIKHIMQVGNYICKLAKTYKTVI